MNQRLATLAAVVAAALIGLQACSGDNEGGQCESCRGSSPRCDGGLSCNTFTGSTGSRDLCASPGTTTCPAF